MGLRRAIDRDMGVRIISRHCIKRLDVSLMDCRGPELALDDEIRRAETGGYIPTLEGNMCSDISRAAGVLDLAAVGAAGQTLFAQLRQQNRRIGLHRIVEYHDCR